jgi:serine/threonine protein kinase
MVLEHVEGLPIDVHCRNQRLCLRDRISLVRRVCAAVRHVHSASIVHCDIKPSNVLITSQGVPKLIDFGIAEVLSCEPARASAHLQSDDVALFTPECAAPEQLRGEPPTAAIDIYGLGLLLYRLVTGRTPYAGHDSRPALLGLHAIREAEPMQASQVVARFTPEHDPGLPETEQLSRMLKGHLDALLSKALSRDRCGRHASAVALSADLRRCLDDS